MKSGIPLPLGRGENLAVLSDVGLGTPPPPKRKARVKARPPIPTLKSLHVEEETIDPVGDDSEIDQGENVWVIEEEKDDADDGSSALELSGGDWQPSSMRMSASRLIRAAKRLVQKRP